MPEQIISIPLPQGWRLETFGATHIAGGFVHLISPDGEIHTRLTASDFQEKPAESAEAMLKAIGEATHNLLEEPLYAYEIAEGLYLGGSPEDLWLSTQHPTDRDVAFDNEAEIIYYDIAEWTDEPEEVIGAFLVATKENVDQEIE